MKSPTTKGLSTMIDSEAKRSPRMFCTASATAMPPTPRPATSAVTSTPRLSSATSSTIDHSRMRAIRFSAPRLVAAAALLATARSREAAIQPPTSASIHKPICRHSAMVVTKPRASTPRSGSSSTRVPSSRAGKNSSHSRVRRSMATTASSTRVCERSARGARRWMTSHSTPASSSIAAVTMPSASAHSTSVLPRTTCLRSSSESTAFLIAWGS